MKYKDKYNLMAEIDKRTNDFCRDDNGNLDNYNDIWIECEGKCRVYHYGSTHLQFYSRSLIRGRNILNKIYENLGKDIIYEIKYTDSEVLFKFKAKDIEKLEPYIKPKTNHAGRSCFSIKNLRKQLGIKKSEKHDVPNEKLDEYRQITSQIGKTNISIYNKINDGFLTNLSVKNNCSLDTFKDKIKSGNYTFRGFIFSLGEETWINYLDYIKDYIKENK
jgi:hypothetical protein